MNMIYFCPGALKTTQSGNWRSKAVPEQDLLPSLTTKNKECGQDTKGDIHSSDTVPHITLFIIILQFLMHLKTFSFCLTNPSTYFMQGSMNKSRT